MKLSWTYEKIMEPEETGTSWITVQQHNFLNVLKLGHVLWRRYFLGYPLMPLGGSALRDSGPTASFVA